MTLEVVNPFPSRYDLAFRYEPHTFTVDLSFDVPEYRITFDVIQAIRVTTEDANPFTGSEPQGLAEVMDPDWLIDLTRVVAKIDSTADFMEAATFSSSFSTTSLRSRPSALRWKALTRLVS